MSRSYEVTAEFYDLLHATAFLETTSALIDRWWDEPKVGVIDVGAGTGIATGLLARRVVASGSPVIVHAVEPSPSMRAVLLSRLAGRPDLLTHVRVHAQTLQRLPLTRVADFALCLNTMSTLDPAQRKDGLAALAAAMVRGGRLVIQRPPTDPGPSRYDLPRWQLGGDTYTGDVTCIHRAPNMVRWRFAYRVIRAESIIREEIEMFDGYLASAASFDAELANAGFAPTATADADIVVARRIG